MIQQENFFRKRLINSLTLSLLVLTTTAIADEQGLALHGFADAGGGFSSHMTPDTQRINGFKIGTIDLYLSPEFEDKVKSLMEIAFEPSHSNGAIGIDVERLQVGYTLSDSLTLWAGRFHTPYGVWNNAFHHGSQLQTTIYRPKFIDFEDGGGIVPAHSVGLWAKGSFRPNENKINYNLYVANGSRILLENANNVTSPGILDMNNYRNDKNHYMVGGTLSYAIQGGAMEGLEVGAHGFGSKVNSYSVDDYSIGPVNSTNVLMTGGFLNYSNNNIEFLTEYYGFSDSDVMVAGSKKLKSNAQFAQLAYTFKEWITPFVRYEKTALNDADNYFTDQKSGKSYTRYAVGFRKDINPKAAIKAEFTRTTKDGTNPKYNIFQYDYAIRF